MEQGRGPVAWLARRLDAVAPGRRGPWWAAPVATGLLVFSTVWGFGRAAFPDVAGGFLVAALVAAVLVAAVLGAGRR